MKINQTLIEHLEFSLKDNSFNEDGLTSIELYKEDLEAIIKALEVLGVKE